MQKVYTQKVYMCIQFVYRKFICRLFKNIEGFLIKICYNYLEKLIFLINFFVLFRMNLSSEIYSNKYFLVDRVIRNNNNRKNMHKICTHGGLAYSIASLRPPRPLADQIHPMNNPSRIQKKNLEIYFFNNLYLYTYLGGFIYNGCFGSTEQKSGIGPAPWSRGAGPPRSRGPALRQRGRKWDLLAPAKPWRTTEAVLRPRCTAPIWSRCSRTRFPVRL